MSWDLAQMPDQSGRTVLVTGVTSGLGTQTARELARRGARVVLAARNPEKLAATRAQLLQEIPDATFDELVVDLSSLVSVRSAAEDAARLGAIDVLVHNAGVMATPERRTDDGLDLQMATNHFGPFLLTGLLLPQLIASGNARVVSVSSNAHHLTKVAPLWDPRERRGRYSRWVVYSQSKLANLLFTFELDRRARAAGIPVRALAAHPGYAATHLLSYGQTMKGSGGLTSILDAVMKAGAQSAEMGALPTLMAATDDLPGGTYCGPGGLRQMRGLPRVVGSNRLSRDAGTQRRFWEISEATTGITYPSRIDGSRVTD
ncbi:SDR family NAD(P)-dependent oxidoreductase [Nocardioides sp. JQ2195]|uniref:oxidoreductase n=1 Tax=Nocardioides sp. JQ2195 TaxID=2592334 RepID=UPI00143E1C85|nr:oxidoreductase [Nocardioides sp. JQ2195]QIX25325.1 SDR family NAD(P)-dependent oxidoreductase [Nocardioides sp. JQ2195]